MMTATPSESTIVGSRALITARRWSIPEAVNRHPARHAKSSTTWRARGRVSARHAKSSASWRAPLRVLMVTSMCLVSVTAAAIGLTAPAGASARAHLHVRPNHHASSAVAKQSVKKHKTKKAKAPGATSAGAVVRTSGKLVGIANFQVGDDYTQNSHLPADVGGNAKAIASAKSLLTSMDTFQNVALMGWGSADPEPSPGVYNLASLDSEVDVMGATVPASQRMITLCSAPGWMKVGGAGEEWNMEAAVAPSHFQDFAKLAALVSERYDGKHRGANGQLLPKVDYFDVWNEMKGFWNTSANTWDYQDYTTMYNDVYRAIKAVRPDALIGGPYAPVGASTAATTSHPSSVRGTFGVVDQRALNILAYWLQHKVGSQFVSMDGGPAVTDESGFASGGYFSAVVKWFRGLSNTTYPGSKTLPIMWAEFYPGLDSTTGLALGQQAVAIDTSNIMQAGTAGVSHMLLWEMEGGKSSTGLYAGESVWTDTADAGGGRPTALYVALHDLHSAFPPGTAVYATAVAGPVTALANKSGVMLVSHSPGAMTVAVNQTRVRMAPYGVTVVGSAKKAKRSGKH
jgi:hypothetical protein